jgi:hypothetical protein
VAPANGGSGTAGLQWWLHWSSLELGSPSTPVSGTHRVYILCSQSGAGSSHGSSLSDGGTETWHATGSNQARAVEVVDCWRGTGSTGEGLQWWDDGTTGASRV